MFQWVDFEETVQTCRSSNEFSIYFSLRYTHRYCASTASIVAVCSATARCRLRQPPSPICSSRFLLPTFCRRPPFTWAPLTFLQILSITFQIPTIVWLQRRPRTPSTWRLHSPRAPKMARSPLRIPTWEIRSRAKAPSSTSSPFRFNSINRWRSKTSKSSDCGCHRRRSSTRVHFRRFAYAAVLHRSSVCPLILRRRRHSPRSRCSTICPTIFWSQFCTGCTVNRCQPIWTKPSWKTCWSCVPLCRRWTKWLVRAKSICAWSNWRKASRTTANF